jgi:hypothetical protein
MVAVRNADDGRVGNGLRAQKSYSRREGWVAVKGQPPTNWDRELTGSSAPVPVICDTCGRGKEFYPKQHLLHALEGC